MPAPTLTSLEDKVNSLNEAVVALQAALGAKWEYSFMTEEVSTINETVAKHQSEGWEHVEVHLLNRGRSLVVMRKKKT